MRVQRLVRSVGGALWKKGIGCAVRAVEGGLLDLQRLKVDWDQFGM